jgi:acyl carrier protein
MTHEKRITVAQALDMLCECFNLPPGTLAPETERDAIQEWDSMGALMLMAELDERFGLELTADLSREMTRVSHVLDFLRTAGELREPA